MKRTPLKRGTKSLSRDPSKGLKSNPGTGLSRDTPLKAKPSTTREFKARAVKNSNVREPVRRDVLERAFERTEGRCVMCGNAHCDPHHLLPVQRWPMLLQEWRNIVPLCRGCHDDHERSNKKVRTNLFPPEFWELLTGHEDRAIYVEKKYDHA